MLEQYMLTYVCPSVCHKSKFNQNG